MKIFTKNIWFILLLPIILSFNDEQSKRKKKIDWNEMTSFRIYNQNTFPSDKTIESYTTEEIDKMNFIETEIFKAKQILKKSIRIRNETYLWKGDVFALATFKSSEIRRIKISWYGGFFLDLKGMKYYTFRKKKAEKWDSFWRKYYHKVINNKDK